MTKQPGNTRAPRTRSAGEVAQANEAIALVNRTRHLLPKCGATARTTGESCRRFAMANGRCDVHGGKTPAGKHWHSTRWPDASAPAAAEKAERKLRDREKAARKRAAKLAAMTPEERAAHDAWQRTHKPGDPKQRAAEREWRRQNLEAVGALQRSRDPAPISAEAAALAAQLADLKRKLAEAQAPTTWSVFD